MSTNPAATIASVPLAHEEGASPTDSLSTLVASIAQLEKTLREMRGEAANRMDAIEAELGRARKRLDTLNNQVWSLRDDLPDLVAAGFARAGRPNN